MFWWAEVGEECRHLVEGSPANSLVVSTAGEVVSDLLLVDPEETVKGKDVGITDERQTVVACIQSLTIRRYLYEEPS